LPPLVKSSSIVIRLTFPSLKLTCSRAFIKSQDRHGGAVARARVKSSQRTPFPRSHFCLPACPMECWDCSSDCCRIPSTNLENATVDRHWWRWGGGGDVFKVTPASAGTPHPLARPRLIYIKLPPRLPHLPLPFAFIDLGYFQLERD